MARRKGKTFKVRPAKPSIAILVDGNTEEWYLNMLKENERDLQIQIKPELPKKKSIKDQYNKIKELAESEYTKVVWIVDFDVIQKETTEARKGTETQMQQFAKLRESLEKNYSNVTVLVNNPCLEFWLLLHFEQTSKYFMRCIDAEKQLKKHLPDYKKTEQYYKKSGTDIYKRLKPKLKQAIDNANKLKAFDANDTEKAICEMGQLFQFEELQSM